MPTPQGSTLSRPGCSIIVQPVTGQTKPTILTRTQDTLRKLQPPTKADLQDVQTFASWVQRQLENVAVAIRPIAQNPLATSLNIIRGYVFTGAGTQVIQHGLGHAYSGWWIVRQQGATSTFVEGAFPAGLTATQVLPLTASAGCTVDVAIF